MSASPTDIPALPPPVAPNLVPLPECEPSYDGLVTDDQKPVECILFEKLYRLLTQPLYASWAGAGRPFLVLANVGWFYREKTPAVCPDCLLSLDVACPPDLHAQQGRSYYQWRMGKPPDVLIEMVSDKAGGEDSFKRDLYARQGVPYYAIYDPEHHLSEETLRTFERSGGVYRPSRPARGRPSGWACACGEVFSRGMRTNGCAGATPTGRSFPPPRSGPGEPRSASGCSKRNAGA